MIQGNRKNKALREAAERAAKNDAAAARKQEAERARKLDELEKPFIALGRDGKEYVYYVPRYSSIERLTAREHAGQTLMQLAPVEYWNNICPAKGIRGDECFAHCQELTGEKRYNAALVRGTGMWRGYDGMVVYNTCGRCYTVREGHMEEMPPVQENGCVYIYKADEAPAPNERPMTDEEGRALLAFFVACPWQSRNNGELMAGVFVQSMMGGFLPLRTHAWITAPAGTGKTTFADRVAELAGGLAFSTKGSSEAGLRQAISGTSRPVLYDEAEPDAGRKTDALLALARYGTNMGNMAMGGETKNFFIASSFLFFSINQALSKAADASRFMHFRFVAKDDKKQLDAAFEAAREAARPGALMARLMLLAPVIEKNVRNLKARLGSGRREELFAHVLACRHALVSRELMTDADKDAAAALFEQSSAARVEEDDAERALNHLMEYRPDHGGATIQEMLYSFLLRTEDLKCRAAEYGVTIIDSKKQGGKRIFVHPGHRDVNDAFKGTEWAKGSKESLLSLSGAKEDRQRFYSHEQPKRGVSFPVQLVFPGLHDPDED